jgi:hypothetical protein
MIEAIKQVIKIKLISTTNRNFSTNFTIHTIRIFATVCPFQSDKNSD